MTFSPISTAGGDYVWFGNGENKAQKGLSAVQDHSAGKGAGSENRKC